MSNEQTSSLTTTDDAVKLFFPGQKISLKPDNDGPQVSFTICKLSKPVTKSIVVLAKPDSGAVVDTEHVVIKIYDPRYLDERIGDYPGCPSCPWDFTVEQEAATNRPEVSKTSIDELTRILHGYPEDSSGEDESEESETDEPKDSSGMDGPKVSSEEEEPEHPSRKDGPKDLSGEDGPEDSSGEDEDDEDKEFRILKEEHYYRLMMESYESELRAYERLKDLQGSAIPRLILTGRFLPPDERAIQPPAFLLEYIPSISLFDITAKAVTPIIREQLLSIIESLPSYGVVHNDITWTNIHFTPPEQPVRAFILDFGCSLVREEVDDEEEWVSLGKGDLKWARRMLEDESLWQPADKRIPRSRFLD